MKLKRREDTKSYQKRKTFPEIFIKNLLVGIVIVLLLSTLSILVCFKYQELLFYRERNDDFTRVSALIRKQIAENPLSDKTSSIAYNLCYCAAYCQNHSINSYIAIKDCETGEYILDSTFKGFLVTDAINGEYALYYCDTLDWKEYFMKFCPENIHYFYTRFGNYVYTQYSVVDAYIKDNKFIPGKIKATVYSASYSNLENSTILEENIIDLTPDNTNGYTYIQIEEEKRNLLTISGNELTSFESAKQLATSSASSQYGLAGNQKYYYSQLASFTDSTGHQYELLSYYEHKYSLWKLNSINFTILITIYLIIMLVVVWILSTLTNNKNKYFYMTEDYRINLINNLAHDLKSPLMAMGGYAENLKENVHTEKREYYVDAIIDNVSYMNTIIADTLELSRFNCKNTTLTKEPVDLCVLSKSIMENYAILIEEKEISVTITGSFIIDADIKEISRVLDNLISNAVKYTKITGEIRINGTKKDFTIENDSSEERPENVNQLWEAFVKGNGSRSNRSGSGLGLTITKNILEMHGVCAVLKYEDGKFIVRIY